MLKPITSGLPSGLRVSDWKMAPLTPSAAPMSSAINTRGSRHSFTTIATLRGASPNSAENTGQSSGAPGLAPARAGKSAGWRPLAADSWLSGGGTGQSQATSPRLAAHQPDQHRRAEKGAHHRYPQFAGHQQAANHVGKQQQGRGGEQGDRQRPAMIGPHQPARHMRHHQADKGDGADDGGGAAAQDGDDDQADQLGAGDAAAEGGGGIVARGSGCSAPGSAAERRSPPPLPAAGQFSAFAGCGYPANRPARSVADRRRPG